VKAAEEVGVEQKSFPQCLRIWLLLEHFHQSCSDELRIRWTAVFLAFGCVSAQLQGCHGTCAFAEALPKAKNPRGSSLHLFCQCSRGILGESKKRRSSSASTLLEVSRGSDLGGLFFPGAARRLDNQAFFDGAGGGADVADLAIGHHCFDTLEVGEKTALRYGGNVRANTAGFFGFTTAPDNAALHRAFACQFTNFCHNNFLSKGARETTSEIRRCKDYFREFWAFPRRLLLQTA